MKLELGAGHRPTRGYEHNDLYPWDHVEHVGEAWMLQLPDNSVDEVLAVAFVEHLTYGQALDTFRNVHRMLKPGGLFLFDVPDFPVWAEYYLALRAGADVPVSMDHVRKTLFGWGRWPGDEHKYGWDRTDLWDALGACGFSHVETGSASLREFQCRAFRQRFTNPDDAHIYALAAK